MKRSIVVLFLSGIACCSPARMSTASAIDMNVDKRVVEIFGGSESVANVASPDKIEAFRIDGSKRPKRDAPLGGYPVISGPVAVDAATGKTLAAILLNADSYVWGPVKNCSIEPGVGVRFTKAGAPTEVLLCFSCDQLEVFRDGKRTGGKDDDYARDPLLKIVKRLFPEDKQMQTLKTHRQLREIADVEVRKQIAQVDYSSRHLKPSVREVLEKEPNSLDTALKAAYPTTDEQVLALLEFEGCTSNWSSFSSGQYAVRTLLDSYKAAEVEVPLQKALGSDNRALRRGAVRFLEIFRAKRPDWKPAELTPAERRKRYAVWLDVLLAEPDYSHRQRALAHLVVWGDGVATADVDRALDAGLHDAEPGVRRSAMLAAGRLRHQASIPVLMDILEGRTPATRLAPKVPQGEIQELSPAIEQVAGKRPEPEVAALALGLMGHAPAVAPITAGSDESPLYEVALALLGQPEHLRADYFNASTLNRELQLAAVEAVVRAKGKYGLDYAVHYRMATHGTEPDEVLDQLKRMLLAEKAPGGAELAACKKLADLQAWYAQHGAEYAARFAPPVK